MNIAALLLLASSSMLYAQPPAKKPTVRQQQQYHEKAVKERVQEWRMFVDECQHPKLKHLYRKPSYCKDATPKAKK